MRYDTEIPEANGVAGIFIGISVLKLACYEYKGVLTKVNPDYVKSSGDIGESLKGLNFQRR